MAKGQTSLIRPDRRRRQLRHAPLMGQTPVQRHKIHPSDYRVKVSNELVYAPIHNWGGTVSVTVTERMRRFAWAKFREANGKTKKNAKGKKNSSKKATAKQMVSPQAAFWRNLALTKKKKLTIRIPQRQFLGESKELNDKINERIEKEIRNVLN